MTAIEHNWQSQVTVNQIVFFQLDFMLDLQITHVINPCEQEIRFDPSKYAKQGICYKGFICKVSGVLSVVLTLFIMTP